jgi:hypothetical protein
VATPLIDDVVMSIFPEYPGVFARGMSIIENQIPVRPAPDREWKMIDREYLLPSTIVHDK